MLVISTIGIGLKLMNITHPFFLSMRFPLLFLHGECGGSTDLDINRSSKRSKRISMREFMRFIMQHRCVSDDLNAFENIGEQEMVWNPLHIVGSLAQEFYATAGMMVEQNRMRFHSMKQSNTRYISPSADVNNERDLDRASRTLNYLPNNIYGTRPYYNRLYHMTNNMFNEIGTPNLFLTFTMNSKVALELQNSFQGCYNSNTARNDLISRVFMEMVTLINRDLEKELNLKVGGRAWITEFQQRGLPHIHMSIYCPKLNAEDPETGGPTLDFDELDKIIKRCLPQNIELAGYVNSLMIHECRPTRCKGDGVDPRKCKKGNFPRQARETFFEGKNARFVPPGGENDANVISYCPSLVYRFRSHIVEMVI